jgi:hypothetical protein
MSPSFDEIVEWLKSLEEGEPLPKPTVTGRMPVYGKPTAFPAAGSFPTTVAMPAPAAQLVQAGGNSLEGQEPMPLPAGAVVSATAAAADQNPSGQPRPADVVASAIAAGVLSPLHINFSHENLAQGIVLAEILGKPMALRGAYRRHRHHL